MNIIKRWLTESGAGKYEIKLFKDKIIKVLCFKDKNHEKEHSFDDYLTAGYSIFSLEDQTQILKEIVKLKKPGNLSASANKIWEFWECFDNENIKKEKYYISKTEFIEISKFGLSRGYQNKHSKKYLFYEKQRFDRFFFYGPYTHSLDIEKRIGLMQKILNILKLNNSQLTVNDAFVVFDYDKIENIDWVEVDGIRGDNLKIADGKVTIAGWDNPRDGGEHYLSIEYFWYNMKTALPEVFHSKMDYLIKILGNAIVRKIDIEDKYCPHGGADNDNKPNLV